MHQANFNIFPKKIITNRGFTLQNIYEKLSKLKITSTASLFLNHQVNLKKVNIVDIHEEDKNTSHIKSEITDQDNIIIVSCFIISLYIQLKTVKYSQESM